MFQRFLLASACVSLLGRDAFASAEQDLRLQVVRAEVRSLLDEGRYAEAEQATEALAVDAARSPRTPAADLEDLEALRIRVLIKNGRGAESRTQELARSFLQRRVTDGRGAADAAQAKSVFGAALFEAGEYEKAADTCREAVQLWDGLPAAESLAVAESLDCLVSALIMTEAFDEALLAANRAVMVRGSTEELGRAHTLGLRGLVFQRRADYASARSDLEHAVKLLDTLHPLHPETADALNLLGLQAWIDGDISRSYDLLRRAVTIAEATLRPRHPALGQYLRGLWYPVQDLGDLTAAKVLAERALAISSEALGDDHPTVAGRWNDLAAILYQLADYEAARRSYERAKTINERRLSPLHSEVTTIAYNLALVAIDLGDYAEATRLLEQSISTWSRVHGAEHPFVAIALFALAETRARESRHAEAIALLERALRIREKAFGPRHPLVAQTLSQLAANLLQVGRPRRARTLSERALRVWDVAEKLNAEQLAVSLIVHGEILLAHGESAEACRALTRALDARQATYGTEHPLTVAARVGLAAALASTSLKHDAWREALAAEDASRNHQRLTMAYLPERQALNYLATRPGALDLALSLVPSSESEVRATLDGVIKSRALVLDEIAARRRRLRLDADDTAPWQTLTSKRQRLANLATRGPGRLGSEEFARILDGARREKEDAERAVAETSAVFSAERRRATVGLDEVASQLKSDEALVSFVRFNRAPFAPDTRRRRQPNSRGGLESVSSYAAFVLRPGDTTPVMIPIGPAAQVDASISAWRRAMVADAVETPATARGEPSFRSLGVSLRRRIWDPVATHLTGVRRVFVVPDGPLTLMPLAALPLVPGRFVLDDGPVIHYLSAERDLVAAPPLSSTPRRALIAGGPSFGVGVPLAAMRKPVAPTTPEGGASAVFRGETSRCAAFRSVRFDDLPGARAEAEAIGRLWRELHEMDDRQAPSIDVLTEQDATEQAIKVLGPGRSVLHIATHGFFLGDECVPSTSGSRGVGGLVNTTPTATATSVAGRRPRRPAVPENPLLLSGLALAGANRRASSDLDEDDGILTAEEVASLDLSGVEWAVLSACETGLGTVAAGEGVLGLRRAFQTAGARTVIMSLWSVDDRATRQWMEALYRARLGDHLDTADAVRQASLTLIRERRANGQSAHPFYWAGFVAAGDWR